MKFQVLRPGARVFQHLSLVAAPTRSPQIHHNHSTTLGLSSLKEDYVALPLTVVYSHH